MAHRSTAGVETADYDAVVIGAGFAGLGMLRRLKHGGLSARVFEAGSGVGGTWFWNKYPGARTDCEHTYYCYQFDLELLQEWSWSERYPSQPEMLSYLNNFATRYDLFPHIQLSTRVTSAHYDESAQLWAVETDAGDHVTARFLITGLGILSTPVKPDFPGVDSFLGESYLTALWPETEVKLEGKRVAVIGTGASGIQIIPRAAEVAEHVYVFQRTPNYVVPNQNHLLSAADEKAVKDNYPQLLETIAEHSFALPIVPKGRLAKTASAEELETIYEAGWQKGGFHFLFDTFDDVLVDLDANATASEFIRSKIRSIVNDPEVARKLSPTTYPFGAKRPPAGTNYYETYNRENVTLIDVNEAKIEGIEPTGVRTSEGLVEVDVIVYATGFDAVTGSIKKIDIRGKGARSITDAWADGPSAYLGLATAGFPNMLMITGPTAPFSNIPAVIEKNIEMIATIIEHMKSDGLGAVETTAEAESGWLAHSREIAEMTVVPLGEKVRSWLTGANIAGKPVELLFYMGGYKVYNDVCADAVADGFRGFVFEREKQVQLA